MIIYFSPGLLSNIRHLKRFENVCRSHESKNAIVCNSSGCVFIFADFSHVCPTEFLRQVCVYLSRDFNQYPIRADTKDAIIPLLHAMPDEGDAESGHKHGVDRMTLRNYDFSF